VERSGSIIQTDASRYEILQDIDKALERMERKGYRDTVHYERLKAKRDAIASGKPYFKYDVAPFLIAYVGSCIPKCNFKDVERNNLIKPRGDRTKAVVSTVAEMSKYHHLEMAEVM
jgi:hypothetical protein